MSDDPCPRCSKHPVEITTMGEREPRHLPACSCYPHPPLCVSCRSVLTDDGRCENVDCLTPFVLQPDPITDPLWGA